MTYKEIPSLDEEKIVKEINEKSIKIFRDRSHLLPINYNPSLRIAHFIFGTNYPIADAKGLTIQLSKLVNIDEYEDAGPNTILRLYL